MEVEVTPTSDLRDMACAGIADSESPTAATTAEVTRYFRRFFLIIFFLP